MKVQWHTFLHLVYVFMHLLQHDVLASLFMHLCGDPAWGNDILAGLGRTQEKYSFQQDGLLDLGSSHGFSAEVRAGSRWSEKV